MNKKAIPKNLTLQSLLKHGMKQLKGEMQGRQPGLKHGLLQEEMQGDILR
jgi:hypothetical protein